MRTNNYGTAIAEGRLRSHSSPL